MKEKEEHIRIYNEWNIDNLINVKEFIDKDKNLIPFCKYGVMIHEDIREK